MKLIIDGFGDGQPLPERFAFGIPDPLQKMQFGENRNPRIRWQDLPAGTRSLVLLCVDSDVPSRADDVNQAGRTIAADLPRVDFYHWVLVDLPPDPQGEIPEGSCSQAVTQGGKRQPPGPDGTRQGLNDFTQFLKGAPGMEGEYFGYDGPCPPWNDALLHHYDFILYATDFEQLPVDGAFDGRTVAKTLAGHVLAEARHQGTYSLNPDVKA